MSQGHLPHWVVRGEMKTLDVWEPPTLNLAQGSMLVSTGFLPSSVSLTVLDKKIGGGEVENKMR